MTTLARATHSINWNKVFRFVVRLSWAISVFAFKLALILLSFITGLFSNDHDSETERRQHYEDDHQFMLDSEYRKRRR